MSGFDMTAANLGFAKEALFAGDAETARAILEPLAEQAPAVADIRYCLASARAATGDGIGASEALDDARTLHAVQLVQAAGIDVARCRVDGDYAARVASWAARLAGPQLVAEDIDPSQKRKAEKDAIVQALIDDEEDTLKHKAVNDWGCSSELAERLVDAPLDEGYMAFSRFAIDKLLPHLERGLKYMGRDKSDSALHAAGYLRPDQRAIAQCEFLPPIREEDRINNPLVKQALFEVRKLVNAIIREYGKPDAIHLELAEGGSHWQVERDRCWAGERVLPDDGGNVIGGTGCRNRQTHPRRRQRHNRRPTRGRVWA